MFRRPPRKGFCSPLRALSFQLFHHLVGIVDLYIASKLVDGIALLHHLHQLLLDEPGGVSWRANSRAAISFFAQFLGLYGTEEQCHAALVAMRWPDGFVCPRCADTRYSNCEPKRLFQCTECRVQTSVRPSTIFHKSWLVIKCMARNHLLSGEREFRKDRICGACSRSQKETISSKLGIFFGMARTPPLFQGSPYTAKVMRGQVVVRLRRRGNDDGAVGQAFQPGW
jgi:Transposase zinc-ribbon domain